VPLVAKIMPSTSYLGISDMSQTIINFGCALAVLGMFDAMYRLFFEKTEDEYKKNVCSTTLIFTIATSLIVCILMILLKDYLAKWFLGNSELSYVIYLSAIATLVTSTNSIISAPTRMQNKRAVYLITNTVSSLLSFGIAIPLLLLGYYIIALPLATVISGISIEISFFIMNRKWFVPRLFDKNVLKQLLIIALPLFPNFLIYWIFNSSDRLMITNLIGVGDEGVYSVGSKLGQTSQLIYIAFAGGWQYFAFSTMKEKKQVKSNSLVFEYLGVLSFTATAFICALSYFIFIIFFEEEYINGYIIAPYLFLAPLLQMLFQVACNQFLIIKKTWPNMIILFSGAIINIILNLMLIPRIGIEGAAIATLVGYISSVLIVSIVLSKMKLMTISFRFIVSTMGMLTIFMLWRLIANKDIILSLCAFILYAFLNLFLYRSDLKLLFSKLKRTKTKKELA